jgi:hypothetical protein
LQEYRTRWPAGLEFPPEDYIAEFAIFLPTSTASLAYIYILLLADTYPNCQNFFGVVDMRELELSAEYVFSVRRLPSGDAYAVLDHARAVDRCEINDMFGRVLCNSFTAARRLLSGRVDVGH